MARAPWSLFVGLTLRPSERQRWRRARFFSPPQQRDTRRLRSRAPAPRHTFHQEHTHIHTYIHTHPRHARYATHARRRLTRHHCLTEARGRSPTVNAGRRARRTRVGEPHTRENPERPRDGERNGPGRRAEGRGLRPPDGNERGTDGRPASRPAAPRLLQGRGRQASTPEPAHHRDRDRRRGKTSRLHEGRMPVLRPTRLTRRYNQP